MITDLLKNFASIVRSKQNRLFTYPIAKQKAYVEHFPEPKDGIERSYFQYCCQMKLMGQPLHFLTNLAALPLAVYYLLSYQAAKVLPEQAADAVFFPDGKPFNIIPDSLQARYARIAGLSADGKTLTGEDRNFLKKIFRRYPVSWMLWLKVIIKVAQYSYAITKHNPQAVISCNEYSYTSSILTEYCHMRGVRLINVMHGEKLYDMHDAFSKYDEFFVWDQMYINLFISMRSDPDQFVIEQPKSLRISNVEGIEKKYDYTYYLTAETAAELEIISKKLNQLQEKGQRISVRPHPRYSDMCKVNAFFPFANIEYGKAVTIEESLLQTGAAIALHSTVLYQAVCNSIPIVIDDIRNPDYFMKLKELQYICLHKEHKLLSEVIGELQ